MASWRDGWPSPRALLSGGTRWQPRSQDVDDAEWALQKAALAVIIGTRQVVTTVAVAEELTEVFGQFFLVPPTEKTADTMLMEATAAFSDRRRGEMAPGSSL
jgi:hypothetical protein